MERSGREALPPRLGGGGWIRTSVGLPRRIYSPLHLTALPPLQRSARAHYALEAEGSTRQSPINREWGGAIVRGDGNREFTIEHEGKKYIKDNPTVHLVCTDFRERVSWAQNGDAPPRCSVQINGTGQIEDDEFALLGSPASRTKKLAVSIRPMPDETITHMRTLIDLHTADEIGDPGQVTIHNAWPVDVGTRRRSRTSREPVTTGTPRSTFPKLRSRNCARSWRLEWTCAFTSRPGESRPTCISALAGAASCSCLPTSMASPSVLGA